MKRILLSLFLFILLVAPSYALTSRTNLLTAQASTNASPSSSVKQKVITQVEQTRITDLLQRAKTEITRRITFLNDLSTKISDLKKLSDTDKTTLKTQIQQQVDGLTTLMAKISADSDLTTLKTDVKSIINDYYIFAFFRVKISLLVAAERLSVAADNMNIIYTKLSTRVAEQKTTGKDVASLEKLLTDMQTKITDAKTQYQAALTELNNLSAQGYPGNRSSLTDARSKIKNGSQDLRVAFQDAVKIRQGLGKVDGNIKFKNGTGSAALTPTVASNQ